MISRFIKYSSGYVRNLISDYGMFVESVTVDYMAEPLSDICAAPGEHEKVSGHFRPVNESAYWQIRFDISEVYYLTTPNALARAQVISTNALLSRRIEYERIIAGVLDKYEFSVNINCREKQPGLDSVN